MKWGLALCGQPPKKTETVSFQVVGDSLLEEGSMRLWLDCWSLPSKAETMAP